MELQILGQKTPIRTNEDSETAQAVLDIAQDRICQAEEKIKKAHLATTPSNVLIMALLELTEEYVKAKQRYQSYQTETQTKIDRLLTQIAPLKRK